MEIININDIEELIICKYKIETELLEQGKIDKKQTLDEFLKTYAYLDVMYKIKNLTIPFAFKKINNIDYLFVINNDKVQLDLILNKLKLIRYDFNNLTKISNEEILKSENIDEIEYLIYKNSYYR